MKARSGLRGAGGELFERDEYRTFSTLAVRYLHLSEVLPRCGLRRISSVRSCSERLVAYWVWVDVTEGIGGLIPMMDNALFTML